MRSFNIFFAGDVACDHNTMSQINQPIPQVTTKRSPSSKVAPNLTPLLHGTTPAPRELIFLDEGTGGGGGGEANGSDMVVSSKNVRIERVMYTVGQDPIAFVSTRQVLNEIRAHSR